MAKTSQRKVLFGGAATGIFVFGIVMAVLGTLFGLPEMRQRLQIDLSQQGNVFLLLYVGILLATLVAGPVIDSIGNKVILVLSAALVASGMAGFAYAHSFGGAAIPAVLLGLGGGGLNTSTNALVSDLYGEDRGPMLNVLGIFYGIGALGIPLLAAVIAGHFPIARQLLICAGLAGACALLFLGMQFPEASGNAKFFVARSVTGRAVPRCVGAGLFVVLRIGERSEHRRVVVDVCCGNRAGSEDRDLDPGGLLGGIDGGKAVGGAHAEVRGETATGAGERTGRACGSGNFVDEPIGRDVGGGSAVVRFLVRRRVSDGTGDCRRHLQEDDGDGVWIVVCNCARGRNVLPVGGGTNFATTGSTLRDGCAARGSGRDLRFGGKDFVG